jgi:N-hydroxyarylamine O-acetyltransferase
LTIAFDLDAYCARVGYDGVRAPSLEVLGALAARQPAAIPFENLDPLLERPVLLEPEALAAKLVAGRRGGYCFELNALLARALTALGFRVTGLGARVCWGAPPERPQGPRSHMLLKVDVDGTAFLVDAGFGGHLLDAPLRLAADVEQQTLSGLSRLRQEDGLFTLQAKLGDNWQDAYRFALEPQLEADYQMANWFTATHPDSLFRNNLLMERLTPERRLSLFNTKLTERAPGGEKRERMLESAAELADVLATGFGIDSPADAGAIWMRIAGTISP